MDTSEKYIEMCLKAKEIQKLWNHDEISFIYHSNNDDEELWLPRQDQLQDMIGEYPKPLLLLCDKAIYYQFSYFSSAEMLWLCFVMYDKYGKRWDDSDWVVE